MKDLIKGKFFTILTVGITVILAGVAIFTAIRLYQLRQESISMTSPESEPAAWDCKNYTFSVSATGVVSVSNSSGRNEPPQQAQVFINDQLVNTFDVPNLPSGQNATLGTVSVPSGESFSWKVIGTLDCQNEGSINTAPVSCTSLAFNLSDEPTATPINSPSPTVTNSPSPTNPPDSTVTPTDRPIGGNSPTPTNQPEATSTSTPTPTTGQIAQVSPDNSGQTLPNAGISTPTIFGLFLGFLLIIASLLLAL